MRTLPGGSDRSKMPSSPASKHSFSAVFRTAGLLPQIIKCFFPPTWFFLRTYFHNAGTDRQNDSQHLFMITPFILFLKPETCSLIYLSFYLQNYFQSTDSAPYMKPPLFVSFLFFRIILDAVRAEEWVTVCKAIRLFCQPSDVSLSTRTTLQKEVW